MQTLPSPGCEICSPSEGEKAPLADPAPPHDTPAAQPPTAHTDGTMIRSYWNTSVLRCTLNVSNS